MPSLSNNELELIISASDKASPVLNGFKKTASSAGTAVSKMAVQVQQGLSQASGALAVVGVGLTAFAKSSVDSLQSAVGSTLALQRQIGGTVENASRLGYAMQRLGIDSGTSSVAFNALAKNIQDVDGPLKDLNVKTKNANGNQRDLNSVLFDVADKFKSMPDGAEKTSKALQLFGKSGGSMVKVLNQGSDGIKELEKQADKLGITLTSSSIEAVAAYTRSQKDLADSANALKVRVGLLTAPALTTLNNTFLAMSQKVTDANTPLGQMVGYVAAFGGPVAGASSALIGFLANIFTINGGLGLFLTAILGVVTALVGGGGLVVALGNLLDLNMQPLNDASKRLFDQLIDSTNKAVGGVDGLAKTPGWKLIKDAANDSIGKIAGYMDALTGALKSGGFKGAIDMIANDLKSIDINGIIGSWLNKFAEFPWEQHTEGMVQGMLRLMSAFAERTEEFVAGATPSLLKMAMGIVNGLISGIIGYAISNPLDFIVLLLSLGFLPGKVVTALGALLSKIPLVGPIAEWVVAAMKVASDFVTAPIKGFFKGVGDTMVKGIKSGWDNAIGWLNQVVKGGLDGIRISVMYMWDFVKGFKWGDALGGAAKGIGNALIALLEGGINGALSGLPGAPKIKIPRFARGTNYAPGGSALVGEEGPEIVDLPRGAKVKTASETRQALGGGGVTIQIMGDVINQNGDASDRFWKGVDQAARLARSGMASTVGAA